MRDELTLISLSRVRPFAPYFPRNCQRSNNTQDSASLSLYPSGIMVRVRFSAAPEMSYVTKLYDYAAIVSITLFKVSEVPCTINGVENPHATIPGTTSKTKKVAMVDPS
ncbi:uncharacterized protein APUU_70347S [Aspergillus puulaauensis]|uniref:Uncharacterized protein n=1 Tax=Aspergillus puulaauensis TaxID=1220207 RepID=A0A7R7XW26_9EURO|nr:uncharacterized protein APUU_70347S [Aspergillus puulaauensis]BCS28777.1 hypothetical protein APUU_70347S [Aspergillus puulaauensis]